MYYRIQNSLNKKVVGDIGQIQSSKSPNDWGTNPRFIENIEFERIEFEPILSTGILSNKAKLTDLISTSAVGFTRKLLVSNMLKEMLQEFDEGNFQFFKCKVLNNSEEHQYWLISPVIAQYNFVDFFKSDVVTRKNKPGGGAYLQPIDLSDKKDFLTYLNLQGIDEWKTFINHIIFKNDMNTNFFPLGHVEGGVGYFVSEELKQAIEEKKITGIEFQPSNLNLGKWLQGGIREKTYGKA